MSILSIRWNPFHPSLFLTCSADWSINLYDCHNEQSLLTFNHNTSIVDIDWAPYKSTVFICVTHDGKLKIYDLSIDKYGECVGEMKVDKKISCTNCRFATCQPIVAIGDDHGNTHILKLSQHLYHDIDFNTQIDIQHEMQRIESIVTVSSIYKEQPYTIPSCTFNTALQHRQRKRNKKPMNTLMTSASHSMFQR